MKFSLCLIPTLRDAPSDADNVSAKLMQRAGLIRKVASGIYDWLPLGLRTLRKVESIVREEMNRIGAQEVSLPVIQPRGLWEKTGRWGVYGKELLRIKDRKDADFCFAPTAEEVVTELVRGEVRSWRQLPLTLYQIGLKFRDEIRPRFGVMRAREFLMKDAYSFHPDDKDAEAGYRIIFGAYRRIFERCGLKFKPVEAQSGAIGGSYSHEFMVLAETGEETIVSCVSCDYAANLERAEIADSAGSVKPQDWKPLEEFDTPGLSSVKEVAKSLGEPPEKFIKIQLYMKNGKEPILALLRGDHELNEAKLAAAAGTPAIFRATEEQYRNVLGCEVGFAGPQDHPNVEAYADFAVRGILNAISGANTKDKHVRNLNYGSREYPLNRRTDYFKDLRVATPDDRCPRCGEKTEFFKGIEIGHTFKLGTKYSEALGAAYLDRDQKPRTMVMGCYGIGISRIVAAAIEQNHDENGIIWPMSLSPFSASIIVIDEADDARVRQAADKIEAELSSRGMDFLEDDRDVKPGVKFKDADLIGIPLRFVVSRKTAEAGCVEFKRRAGDKPESWPLDEIQARLDLELSA
ncbi:MAG: proline--tRNA ligase [Elusimicrobiota bacterium]